MTGRPTRRTAASFVPLMTGEACVHSCWPMGGKQAAQLMAT